MPKNFLPVCKDDLKERAWDSLDIILVTGDAYVDHPSYSAALIGRLLEDAGFKVGIIAQPDCERIDDFLKLGRPRLFFGVTAGNVDSLVANYTANKKVRNNDDYSPGGRAGLRPDRAGIIYANKIREAFKSVPIVLGGLEASLRRLAHYDYWSDKVRRSILLDSKADILVYGMGESQVLEIARRLKCKEDVKALDNIPGTVIARNNLAGLKEYVEIPSFEEAYKTNEKFNESFKLLYFESDPFMGRPIVQRHGQRYVIQYPPAPPLTTAELDRIYEFDYARDWHPMYDRSGGVPGFETVRFSVISNRGCCGECSFCSLYLHQGRIVQSRSIESMAKEIEAISRRGDFKGVITDIGGPTANLYMAHCRMWDGKGACKNRKCLVPEKCKDLKLGYEKALELWRRLRDIPKVKHVFIGSGVRYDLLVGDDSDEYLKELCAHHVSGQLKVAPEHCADKVLDLMNKPRLEVYERFVKRYDRINKLLNKKQFLVNYFISSHPGSSLEDALDLAVHLSKKKINPEQIQDYLPLPMTISSCMYYTGRDPFTGKTVYVARGLRERRLQRALMQHRQPANKKLVLEALRRLKRTDLAGFFYQ